MWTLLLLLLLLDWPQMVVIVIMMHVGIGLISRWVLLDDFQLDEFFYQIMRQLPFIFMQVFLTNTQRPWSHLFIKLFPYIDIINHTILQILLSILHIQEMVQYGLNFPLIFWLQFPITFYPLVQPSVSLTQSVQYQSQGLQCLCLGNVHAQVCVWSVIIGWVH